MRDVVLNEVKKGLSLKERIVVNLNKKIFIKVYHKTRIETIDKLMQF